MRVSVSTFTSGKVRESSETSGNAGFFVPACCLSSISSAEIREITGCLLRDENCRGDIAPAHRRKQPITAVPNK